MIDRAAILTLAIFSIAGPAYGSGHGPVFGGATPTLGKGGWSLDQAWMGRATDDRRHEQLLRTMLSGGITEDLQISVSLPIPLESSGHMPTGRMMAMMSGHRELEGLLGWRFHRRAVGAGRFESTVYVGGTVPLQDRVAGMATAPAASLSVATGYASRTHYVWVGAGYQRYAGSGGDRLGDVKFYSAVYGLRPKFLQLEYPKPDLRFFVEAVGEHTGAARHALPTSNAGGIHLIMGGSRMLLVGPTALLLYKAYGISGGVLFPVYQRAINASIEERFRFGVNVSYFFWPKGE